VINNELYKETPLGNNQFLREFDASANRDAIEEWHRDREDRIVEVVENTDWLIQLDNELPILLKEKLYISKETYHRVIMGKSKLVVKITKIL
jgi:hypothetical protein